MTQQSDADKHQNRRAMELVLLKALIWKSPHTPHIIAALSPADFLHPAGQIYKALVNMIDIGIDIKARTLQDALETPINLPLFDSPPSERDVSMCLEYFKHRNQERRKAVDKIMEWKKSIDEYTTSLHEGTLDPSAWLEKTGALLPIKKVIVEKVVEKVVERAHEESHEPSRHDRPSHGQRHDEGELPGTLEPQWGSLLKSFEKGTEFPGLLTGIEELDKKSLGLKGLIMLAGLPKMGKTTFALQLATEVARMNNVLTVFYSLEMDRNTLLTRTLSRISMIPCQTLIHSRLGKLSQAEAEAYRKATKSFSGYKDRIMMMDRSTTDLNTDQIYFHLDRFIRKTGKDRLFVVVDSLESLCHLRSEGEKTDAGLNLIEKNIGKFRLLQQIFNATILLVFPKNFSPIFSENIRIHNKCYDYVYPVDSFYDFFNKAESKTPTDYHSEAGLEVEEIDLWATCRDTGQWYVPLTFIKSCFTFMTRKSGFKATKISWTPPPEDESPPPQQQQQYQQQQYQQQQYQQQQQQYQQQQYQQQ